MAAVRSSPASTGRTTAFDHGETTVSQTPRRVQHHHGRRALCHSSAKTRFSRDRQRHTRAIKGSLGVRANRLSSVLRRPSYRGTSAPFEISHFGTFLQWSGSNDCWVFSVSADGPSRCLCAHALLKRCKPRSLMARQSLSLMNLPTMRPAFRHRHRCLNCPRA